MHPHHKINLQRLQHLHQATPDCVVFFLGGSLPGTCILHLWILHLFGMIARLEDSHILHKHDRHILFNPENNNVSKSWFTELRYISQPYGLPGPSPCPTNTSRSLIGRLHVLDWWQIKLRGEAQHLDSLEFIKPSYMSLKDSLPCNLYGQLLRALLS